MENTVILNLGCGLKTSDHPRVVNIDWSIRLRLRRIGFLQPAIRLLVGAARREKFDKLPDNILVHDLSKGIPYSNNSVGAVYHSHMLEHLDRNTVEPFLEEVLRVLAPGGIHRIVVPDLEVLCRDYLTHLELCERDDRAKKDHDKKVYDIFEQCVRRDAASARNQGKIRKTVEKLVMGDARKRGETHQWMYDKHNLGSLLQGAGYEDVQVLDYKNSQIPDWTLIGLDVNNEGQQYKPGSLYIEAKKPR